ncbi:MAG: extracellular solute-binding protein [Clostridia bacterium]|nr:extracellular solute-binding protein [Clostridia bacterium]
MKKISSFLLAALMVCSTFVSCADDNTPAQTTDGTITTAAPVTTEPAEDTPDLPDPSELDISGEFRILVSGNSDVNDFESEDDEGTTVEIAIYRRNAMIQEKYGVEITNEDVVKFNSATGSGTGFTKVYTDYMAGESNYDAAMIGTYDVATLAYSGYIHDLNDIQYLDLSKSYWDQKANKDLSIAGRMYYTTGDISIADNKFTHAILFNKDLIKDYDLENPYELVRNNQWTLEKFSSMVKQVGEDLNQDGVYNASDLYGLLTWKDPLLAVLASAGEKIATINDNGQLELTLYSERVLGLYDQFTAILYDQAHVYDYQYDNVTGGSTPSSTWDTNRDAIFNEERAVFYHNVVRTGERHRDSEVDFGFLPYPKMDASQEDYGHFVSAYHTQFLCVPEAVENYARTGIILEELAYYGKQLLTPAYYEQTLIGQTTRDEESAEMLDIIFATRVYDVGIYYNIGTYKEQLVNMHRTRQAISSMYETYKTSAEQKISSINTIFAQQ